MLKNSQKFYFFQTLLVSVQDGNGDAYKVYMEIHEMLDMQEILGQTQGSATTEK